MVTDVSERTLGDPKHAAMQRSIPTGVDIPAAPSEKKE